MERRVGAHPGVVGGEEGVIEEMAAPRIVGDLGQPLQVERGRQVLAGKPAPAQRCIPHAVVPVPDPFVALAVLGEASI